jgi:hypothetical protein
VIYEIITTKGSPGKKETPGARIVRGHNKGDHFALLGVQQKWQQDCYLQRSCSPFRKEKIK